MTKTAKRAYDAERYSVHRAKYLAYQATYRSEHAEKKRSSKAASYIKYRSRILAQQAEYLKRPGVRASRKLAQKAYDATPSGIAARQKASRRYRKSAKGRITAVTATAKRRAIQRRSTEHHSSRDWLMLLAAYHGRCVYCLAAANTRDHVVPIHGGGGNEIANIVPSCFACNRSKSDTPLLAWLSKRPPTRKESI